MNTTHTRAHHSLKEASPTGVLRSIGVFACLIGTVLVLCSCGTHHAYRHDNDVLRVGVSPDYPPVIYKTNGVIAGVEAELAALVAAHLNTQIEFVEMPFDDLIPALKRGAIDVVMSGMATSDIRQDEVRFTLPYMMVGQMALVQESMYMPFRTGNALYEETTRVGSIRGTTGELFVKENLPGTHVSFVTAEKGVAALQAGDIDVFIDDAPFVLFVDRENPELRAVGWLLTDERLAWAVPTHKGYDFLYEELNTFLRRAKQRGDVRRVISRYFTIHVGLK